MAAMIHFDDSRGYQPCTAGQQVRACTWLACQPSFVEVSII
jgi:hypothetical protein